MKDSLYELWAKKNPKFEEQYLQEIIVKYAQYGGGSDEKRDDSGKIYGSGYEMYIYAFFLGVYANYRRKLSDNKKGILGQPIQYWGNVGGRQNRTSYEKIRDYIFAILIAKTDVDYISLDKGEITPEEVVKSLLDTMEEYANGGFQLIAQRQEEISDYFFKNTGFLDLILEYVAPKETDEVESFD